MPIEITEPVTGGAFGPAFTVHASTDIIGPIPADYFWLVELFDPVDEDHTQVSSNILVGDQASDHQMFYFWNSGIIGQFMPFPAWSTLANGATTNLRVSLHDQDGLMIESTTVSVKYDTQTNVPYILGTLSQNTAGLGALATDVADIKAASFASFGSQLVPISQLLQSPPIGLLVRELIGDLSGEGTLTRPEGPFNVNAFGLAWEVLEAGEGIGVAEGAPDRLVTHMLDLQLVHVLADANNETTSVVSFDYGDALWLFAPMLPHEVKYWIGPSVTLRMYWLLVV
jgi:hypothetical protein